MFIQHARILQWHLTRTRKPSLATVSPGISDDQSTHATGESASIAVARNFSQNQEQFVETLVPAPQTQKTSLPAQSHSSRGSGL